MVPEVTVGVRRRGASEGRLGRRPSAIPGALVVLVGVALLSTAPMAAAARPPPGAHVAASLTVPAPTADLAPTDAGLWLNLSVNASGISGGSNNSTNWHYAWSGLPTNCSSADAPNVTCVPSAAGNFSITVSVRDNVTNETGTSPALALRVNPELSLATFTVSSSRITLGDSVTFRANATGGTGPFVFGYSGLPPGCDGNGSTLTCTPTIAATYNCSVAAFDSTGAGSAILNLTFTVAPPASSSGTHPTAVEWGIIGLILVVGIALTVGLLIMARRVERTAFGPGRPPAGGAPPNAGAAPPSTSPSEEQK